NPMMRLLLGKRSRCARTRRPVSRLRARSTMPPRGRSPRMADLERPGAGEWVPAAGDTADLRSAVHSCRGCELWRPATQAVFSSGRQDAPMMLVGEQPGDREDQQGEPFVGPAGRVLDDALEAAGIDPANVYVTNAVKHFRFEERGKRQI